MEESLLVDMLQILHWVNIIIIGPICVFITLTFHCNLITLSNIITINFCLVC